MKRIIALFISTILLLSIAACGTFSPAAESNTPLEQDKVTEADNEETDEEDTDVLEALPDVVITNGDSTDGIELLFGSVTTTEGEYKEGSGAFKSAEADVKRLHFFLNNPVNITEYLNGYLYLKFCIDKPDNLETGLIVDIGTDSTNCRRWLIAKEDLKSGWNELCLGLSVGKYEYDVGSPDLTNLVYVKIHQYVSNSGAYKRMITIVDDIRVMENLPGQAITNCDSTDELALKHGLLTTETREFKEGEGAFASFGAEIVRTEMTLNKPIDITEYAGGLLHLWLYIDNRDKLQSSLTVELGSDSENCYQWTIPKENLKNDWNELYLDLDESLKIEEITYFRLLQNEDNNENITVIVDDIRVVKD
ncbi:MAG: hypothetical protein IJZ53_05575 [Tyzzerella sp.]|nr:hypothetical protein [Tyzzerella sp.]